MPTYEEYCAEIRELWDSHRLTNMGIKHQQLEKGVKEYLQAEQLTLFANGHLALTAVLAAFEFPAGSEVITIPFTFASTTHAIVQNALVPVFCDIREDDFTLNASKVEALITDKTCAILPVHVYGNICDVQEIQRIADKHHLKVIYDAAHAFGVTCGGVSVASFGDASMFSFHATKVFHTVEGGAVVCRDEKLHQKLDALKNFGMIGQEDIPYVGGNAKMSEFHAAMGLCNLRHIDEEIAKRKVIAEYYRSRLESVPGLRLNPLQTTVQSNYAYFPVVISPEKFGANRDEVCEVLEREEIYARKYFYPLTNQFACYAGQYDAVTQTPVALRVSERVLALPLHTELERSDVDRVCEVLLRCAK